MGMDNEKMRTTTHKPVKRQVLIEWRERMGYSQRDAAKEVGSSRQAWKDWESGKTKVPRYIGLALAALALGMLPYGQVEDDIDLSKE